MFRGDSTELTEAFHGAFALARDLGHSRVGTEHLLLSLSRRDDVLSRTLHAAGVTPTAIESVIGSRTFTSAAVEADRAALGLLGIDFDRLREQAEASLGPVRSTPGRGEHRCFRSGAGVPASGVRVPIPQSGTPRRPRTRRPCGWL